MPFARQSRRLPRLSLLAASAVMCIAGTTAASAYSVICKHGKYDIDSRSQEQLKMAFGTSYCTLQTFSYRSDAENFAKKNNMTPGKSCSCR